MYTFIYNPPWRTLRPISWMVGVGQYFQSSNHQQISYNSIHVFHLSDMIHSLRCQPVDV